MRDKKIAIAMLLLGIIGTVANFVLKPFLEGFGICNENSFPELCFNLFYRGYLESLALFGGALILVSLVLFLVDKRAHRPWLIFAIIYAVIYAIAVFATPPTSGLLQPQRDLISLWLSIAFVIISLSLIAYKSWRLKAAGVK